MSLKTFISNLLVNIKSFFAKVPKPLKEAIRIGVLVTENIKKFQDTGLPDIITKLIPGEVDDMVAEQIRIHLPKILTELKLTQNCSELTDPNEIVSCAIGTLQQISGDFQSAFLHNLSILIAQTAADGKLTWTDGVYIMEWYYQNYQKK